MVRLRSALNQADGKGAGFPDPFTAGTPRPPGVHLHWAVPDAMLRGRLASHDGPQPARRCPRFPTAGWCCGCSRPTAARRWRSAGWVLEADRAVEGRTRRLAGGRARRRHPPGPLWRPPSSPARRAASPRGRPPTTRSKTASRFTTHSTTSHSSPPTVSPAPAPLRRGRLVVRHDARSARRRPRQQQPRRAVALARLERGHALGRHAGLSARPDDVVGMRAARWRSRPRAGSSATASDRAAAARRPSSTSRSTALDERGIALAFAEKAARGVRRDALVAARRRCCTERLRRPDRAPDPAVAVDNRPAADG